MKKLATPPYIPIEVIKILKKRIIGDPRIFYVTQMAEILYQEFIEYKCYGPKTKEIADWFWWAVRRHVMYRTGELEKDEWQKGGEDFEDFFESEEKFGPRYSFRLEKHEVSRLPAKYEEMYFYHRLDFIIETTLFLTNRQMDAPSVNVYEYFETIPLRVRIEYFRDRYESEPMKEMKKFEGVLYKEHPKKPVSDDAPKAQVYQMPLQGASEA